MLKMSVPRALGQFLPQEAEWCSLPHVKTAQGWGSWEPCTCVTWPLGDRVMRTRKSRLPWSREKLSRWQLPVLSEFLEKAERRECLGWLWMSGPWERSWNCFIKKKKNPPTPVGWVRWHQQNSPTWKGLQETAGQGLTEEGAKQKEPAQSTNP